jgi:triosephosphate isomerase
MKLRIPIIAGNWKMNMSIKEGVEFIKSIKTPLEGTDVEVVICAPFTMLKDLKETAKGSNIKIWAQNMHYNENGAFTGEISPMMLKEIDMDYVIIGHSERRQYYNETDETVNKKVIKALEV